MVVMSEESENTEKLEEQAPKRKKKLIIPWKGIGLYCLPAIVTFILFIIMHNMMVKALTIMLCIIINSIKVTMAGKQ